MRKKRQTNQILMSKEEERYTQKWMSRKIPPHRSGHSGADNLLFSEPNIAEHLRE
jgi:hypothetical protein